jgi:cytochrome c oxidase subunit 2
MNLKTAVLAVLAGGIALNPALTKAAESSPRIIAITAKRFEFSPKEVHLRKGETVVLRLTSEDVTHGLMVRALDLDADIEPGKVTDVTVTPRKGGRFTAICDHFCGSGHGNMKMTFVVDDPDLTAITGD